MTPKPITFTGPNPALVRSGAKTQTRRPVKPQPTTFPKGDQTMLFWDKQPDWVRTRSDIAKAAPHKVGSRLYVREAIEWADGFAFYQADGAVCRFIDTWPWKRPKLAAMFMPRGCWRTMIEITDVRVERVCEITEEDAKAEGVTPLKVFDPESYTWDYRGAFEDAWSAMHGPSSWEANPWVFVYQFKVAEVRG